MHNLLTWGLMSRKASARSSSYTLSEGHFPDKMLSNTVFSPAPSLSDDLYSAAAALAAATSSILLSPAELNSLLLGIKFLGRDELATTPGEKAVAIRGDDAVASKRGMSLPTLQARGEVFRTNISIPIAIDHAQRRSTDHHHISYLINGALFRNQQRRRRNAPNPIEGGRIRRIKIKNSSINPESIKRSFDTFWLPAIQIENLSRRNY